MCSIYDNTIPGFNTLVALITAESTSYKGNTYPQFFCRHGFVFKEYCFGWCCYWCWRVCSWFVCRGRLVLRIHMCWIGLPIAGCAIVFSVFFSAILMPPLSPNGYKGRGVFVWCQGCYVQTADVLCLCITPQWGLTSGSAGRGYILV